MTFFIQRKLLLGLGNWLNTLSLNGRQMRAKNKFVGYLQEALERFEKDRLAIVQEYAEKEEDDKDKLKMVEKDGTSQYVVPDDKLDEFNSEVAKLYEENAEITAPEIATTLMIVRDIVLNTDEKIAPSYSIMYDKWCEAFEALSLPVVSTFPIEK